MSLRESLAIVVNNVTQGLVLSLGIVFLYCQLRRAVRRDWIAGTILALLIGMLAVATPDQSALSMILSPLIATAALLIALIRFGLVAVAAHLVSGLFASNVVTLDPSAWYAAPSMLSLAASAALAAYAWHAYAGTVRLRPAT